MSAPVPEVLGSEPSGRHGGGRGGPMWWLVAVLAVGALVLGALREPGGTGEPSASPTPSLLDGPPGIVEATPSGPVEVDEPDPAPRLAAPPGDPVLLTVVEESAVFVGGRPAYRAAREDRIDSFTPLRGGFAAIVVEEPARSANPATLVVGDGTRIRRITVDEGTSVVADMTPATFWTTRPGGETQRRSATGGVLSARRVPGPWRAVAGTVAGLVLVDDRNGDLGLLRGTRVDVLARRVTLGSVTPTHAVWTDGTCAVSCDVVVRDLRSTASWSFVAPGEYEAFARVEVSPSGDAVAMVGVRGEEQGVLVTGRGEATAVVTASPEGSVLLGYYDVEWVDGERVGVFDVADTVEVFAYDLRSGELTHAGSHTHASTVLDVYAAPR